MTCPGRCGRSSSRRSVATSGSRFVALPWWGTDMAGPLSGYKILELAGIGPGPFAAMMLADWGAGWVRGERGPSVRGHVPATPNGDLLLRGRRNIAVDLKHPDGV